MARECQGVAECCKRAVLLSDSNEVAPEHIAFLQANTPAETIKPRQSGQVPS